MKAALKQPSARIIATSGGPSLKGVVVTAVSLLIAALFLYNAQTGPISPSTRNPEGIGAPLPIEPAFPSIDFIFWGQVAGAIIFVGTILAMIWGWRRHPRHPLMLMVFASNSVLWLDPFNNWSLYLVYNPRLWHFPQDWPWVGNSPIIEPLTSFIYAPYVLPPYFVGIWLLRRLQATRSSDSFVWRHALLSLGFFTFCAGVIWDASQEILLVNTQFLTYTHIIPFGSLYVGEYRQFPILMASLLITIVMIPAAVLLYRDDTGKCQAEKLAQRLGLYRTHPATATFLIMALILNLSFMGFISAFYTVRVTGLATSVACPWPYPESKVYDPHGYYEREGQPGPFWAGRMSTWMSGQPDGRPENIAHTSDRCSPRDWNNPE
jgi:hypothetical protein